MSNPTTPFSWQMPTNTDLVTDLPADFEVFGQAVATSLADLLGGTTGQVLKKNTNADMDFVWSADAAGMTNPMTTTGDVIYSSPGSTPVRLGIGTANQVLAVNSGATAPEWKTISSGGMTLISTTTFNNTTTNYTLSSIPQTYKHLLLIGNGLQSSYAGTDTTFFRYNGDTTANYGMAIMSNVAANIQLAGDTGNDKMFNTTTTNMAADGDASSRFGNFTLNIYDYTDTSYKAITYVSGCNNGNTSYTTSATGLWNNTAAITSISFTSLRGSNLKAGTVRLYGVL